MAGHDWHTASDAELLACFVAGRDQRAFAEIVRRHGPMVLAAARRILRHEQDAEDAFQATFLALASAAGRLRRRDALAAWLHQTAVRSAKSIGGSNARWVRTVERRKESAEESYTNGQWDDVREVLDDELERLPARYRAAIVLCDLEGLSRKEAAVRLGVPLATVCSLVVRGRKRLHRRLVRRGVVVSASGLAASLTGSASASAEIGPAAIQQTTQHALMFAAGKSAVEAGISTTVIHTAQGVLRVMTITKLTMLGAAALAIVFVLSAIDGLSQVLSLVAKADTIFFDNFHDGDATDGSPATWKPVPFFDTGGYGVVDGDYVLNHPSGPGTVANAKVAYADIAPIDDTSIRAQLRQLQGFGPIGILARADIEALTAYQAGIDSPTSSVYIARNNGPVAPPILATAPTSLNPSLQDVVLQFDVIGNELRLFVWPAGEPKPAVPVLSVSDDTYSSGVPGLLINGSGPHSAAFRYVHVADTPIPKPSTWLLGALCLAGLCGFVLLRRNRFD